MILNTSFEFISLLFLSSSSTIGDIPELAFVLTISKDLLAAQVLLLLSKQAFGICLLFTRHLGLTHLHLALIHNSLLLLSVHALEMVGLDAMRC